MEEVEVKVVFKTITPLWTGDAWQENSEIRPSSLMGSLRFWFEVICYFGGICNERDFNSQLGRFEKEVDREKLKNFIKKNGNSIELIINHLITEQRIPLPSIIFGTTNWRSLIEIKSIEEKREVEDINIKIVPRKNWFLKKGAMTGVIEVTFNLNNYIFDSVLLPLLNFMDKYGYWGGGWNIGYGRLKVVRMKINNQEFNDWNTENFELDYIIQENCNLNINDPSYEYLKKILNINSFFCKSERYFNNKISQIPNKLVVIKIRRIDSFDFYKIIKQLLYKKIEIRNCLRPNQNNYRWKSFRHKLLGELREGSKIFPYIYKEENQLKGGFLSIAGLLNLENIS